MRAVRKVDQVQKGNGTGIAPNPKEAAQICENKITYTDPSNSIVMAEA